MARENATGRAALEAEKVSEYLNMIDDNKKKTSKKEWTMNLTGDDVEPVTYVDPNGNEWASRNDDTYLITSKIGNYVSSQVSYAADFERITSFIKENAREYNGEWIIEDDVAIGRSHQGNMALVNLTKNTVVCDDITFKIEIPNDVNLVNKKSFENYGEIVNVGYLAGNVAFYRVDMGDFVTIPNDTKLVQNAAGDLFFYTDELAKNLVPVDTEDDVIVEDDEDFEKSNLSKENNNVYSNGVAKNIHGITNREKNERIRNNHLIVKFNDPKNTSMQFTYEGLLKLNKTLYDSYEGAGEIRKHTLPVDDTFEIKNAEDIEAKANDLFNVYYADKEGNVTLKPINELLNDKRFLEDKKRVLTVLSSFIYNGHKLSPFENGNSATINAMAMQIAECCGFKLDLKKLESLSSQTEVNKLEELAKLFDKTNETEWTSNFLENLMSDNSHTPLKNKMEENAKSRKEVSEKIKSLVSQNVKLKEEYAKTKIKGEKEQLKKEISEVKQSLKKMYSEKKKLESIRKIWENATNLATKDESQYFNKMNKILNQALEPISLKQTNQARANSGLNGLENLNTYEFGNEIIRLSQIKKEIDFEKVDTKYLSSKITRNPGQTNGFKWERDSENDSNIEERTLTIYTGKDTIEKKVTGSNFPQYLIDKNYTEYPIIDTQIDKLNEIIDANNSEISAINDDITSLDPKEPSNLPFEAQNYQLNKLEQEQEEAKEKIKVLEEEKKEIEEESKKPISNMPTFKGYTIYNEDGTTITKEVWSDETLRVIEDFSSIKPYNLRIESRYAAEEINIKNYDANEFVKKVNSIQTTENLEYQKLSWSDGNSKGIKYSLEFTCDNGSYKLIHSDNVIFNPNADSSWEALQSLKMAIEEGYIKNPQKLINSGLVEQEIGKQYSTWDFEKKERVILEGKGNRHADFKNFKNKNLKFISEAVLGLVDKAFIEYVPKQEYDRFHSKEAKMDSLCIIRDVELTKGGQVNAIVERNNEYYVVNDLLTKMPDFSKCPKTEAKTLDAARELHGDNKLFHSPFRKKITSEKGDLIQLKAIAEGDVKPMARFKEIINAQNEPKSRGIELE